VILGLGTAAVYPTLIAQVSDLVTPRDRASGVGIYRLWRDLGYVAGGLLAGVLADLLGFRRRSGWWPALTALSSAGCRPDGDEAESRCAPGGGSPVNMLDKRILESKR
jgi:MFS family permease